MCALSWEGPGPEREFQPLMMRGEGLIVNLPEHAAQLRRSHGEFGGLCSLRVGGRAGRSPSWLRAPGFAGAPARGQGQELGARKGRAIFFVNGAPLGQ